MDATGTTSKNAGSTGMEFNEEAAKNLVAAYITPDVIEQRRLVLQASHLFPGARVLDVGSGPGFFASEVGDAVGSSGWVAGVDISQPLLSIARAHCAHQEWVEFRLGSATQLPFPDEQFDIGISTQTLEFVPDISAALHELYRVLRPGGWVIILDTDWDSIVWHSSDRSRMLRVLAAWEGHAAHPDLPRRLARLLRQTNLEVETQQLIPMFNPSFSPDTFSNHLIDLIVKYVSGRAGVMPDEARAWAAELRQLGQTDEYFFSLNRYLFVGRKRNAPA